jgi:PadR family transcriptional regulator PadR
MGGDPSGTLDTNLRRGVAQYCVLAVLARGERCGADLVRDLAGPGGLVAGEGTVYPLLTRLAAAGWLHGTWREERGRQKKFYAVTPAGISALHAFSREWTSFVGTVESILSGQGDAP